MGADYSPDAQGTEALNVLSGAQQVDGGQGGLWAVYRRLELRQKPRVLELYGCAGGLLAEDCIPA